MSWLTDPTAKPGKRNTPIDGARMQPSDFANYEDQWDLLDRPAFDAPVLLPHWMRDNIDNPKVGLPDGHRWRDDGVPEFVA